VTSTGATVLSNTPYFSNTVDREGLAAYITSFIAATAANTSSGLTVANATATAEDYINDDFAQGTHFVGTAKIGDVVDTDTKVFGTDNLFVVDASIHADLPTGNTMAIIMVVAEQAAKRILALK
jgi:cellobiose dehydrogenase (acceptor)